MHKSQSYTMHSKVEVRRDVSTTVIILHHLPSSSVTCDFTQYPEFGYVIQFDLTWNRKLISSKRIS
jgi:hypothetical protein